MKLYSILLCAASAVLPHICSAHIGDWQLLLASRHITEVAQGTDSCYYVLADGALSRFDARNGTLQSIGRNEGLTGVAISHIGFSVLSQSLIIAYEDHNLDLLFTGGKVLNMPEYQNKPLPDNKDIHAIYIDSTFAYLKTDFGFLKVDMQEATFLATLPPDDHSFPRVNPSLVPSSVLPDDLFHNSPVNNFHYRGIIHNGRLLTVPGIWRHYGNSFEQERAGEVQSYDIANETWGRFSTSFVSQLPHKYLETSVIAAHPTLGNRYAVGSRTGIYLFDSDTLVQHFNCYNSPLKTALPDDDATTQANYTICESLCYDDEGNLWMLNDMLAYTNEVLLCLTPDGHWKKYIIDIEGRNRGLASLMFDADGHLWFVRRDWKSPYICCFDPETQQKKLFTSLINQNGSSLGSDVSIDVIAEGPDDRLWIGTSHGLAYLNKRQKYSNKEEHLYQHIVPRNDGSGLGDYLLNGVAINDIKFDAAGRMWVCTLSEGVYLISANRNEMLAHFTTDNSLLPDNNVWSCMLDANSNLVAFCTDKGLALYESDAAPGAQSWGELYCYPNPVRPDFTGKLTISGIKNGATVYITDANHQLVHKEQVMGSILTWDLLDSSHQRIQPGVYFIHAIDEDGLDGGRFKFLVL